MTRWFAYQKVAQCFEELGRLFKVGQVNVAMHDGNTTRVALPEVLANGSAIQAVLTESEKR